jgi:hypothetical protein
MELYAVLFQAAAVCKHRGFEAEQEWRLISPLLTSGVKHRAGTESIIPYDEFELPRDERGSVDVRHTVIGPTAADEETARSAVESIYTAIGLPPGGEYPRVSRSIIPYRHW